MRTRERVVKYSTYLSVRTLWMAPIYESTIHRIFVACLVSMKARKIKKNSGAKSLSKNIGQLG